MARGTAAATATATRRRPPPPTATHRHPPPPTAAHRHYRTAHPQAPVVNGYDLVGKWVEVEGITGPAEVVGYQKQGWAAVSLIYMIYRLRALVKQHLFYSSLHK